MLGYDEGVLIARHMVNAVKSGDWNRAVELEDLLSDDGEDTDGYNDGLSRYMQEIPDVDYEEFITTLDRVRFEKKNS